MTGASKWTSVFHPSREKPAMKVLAGEGIFEGIGI